MQLLKTDDNVVFVIATTIEKGRFEVDPSTELYRYNDNGYVVASCCICEVFTEAEPTDYEPYKYLYTSEDGFTLNPNWSEPIPPEAEEDALREMAIDHEFRIMCLELGLDASDFE